MATVIEIKNKEKPKFDNGEKVKLTLFSRDGHFKNALAMTYFSRDGQIGIVIGSEPYPLKDKTVFLYKIEIDNRKVELFEDCLEIA